MPKDTVLTSIEYIRIANIIFNERDYLSDEVYFCNEINKLNARLVNDSDSVINKLELKVENLELINGYKDKQLKLEQLKLLKATKTHRKEKFAFMGGAGVLIILLIIL